MASIAPILRIRGKVRQVTERHVAAVEARAAFFDQESGRPVPAREARDAYDVLDVLVDTFPGGFAEFVITPGAMASTGGWVPKVGDELDLPVRGYTNWKGPEGRRYATNGYSLAGDVLKDEGIPSTSASGARVSAVS